RPLGSSRRFFFQAEDGIRDFHVTGVQTCALPISLGRATSGGAVRSGSALEAPKRGTVEYRSPPRLSAFAHRQSRPDTRVEPDVTESEERRVGKECRSRWPQSHDN